MKIALILFAILIGCGGDVSNENNNNNEQSQNGDNATNDQIAAICAACLGNGGDGLTDGECLARSGLTVQDCNGL